MTALTFTWISTGTANWNTGADWNDGTGTGLVANGSGDRAFINQGVVTLTSDQLIGNLNVNGGALLLNSHNFFNIFTANNLNVENTLSLHGSSGVINMTGNANLRVDNLRVSDGNFTANNGHLTVNTFANFNGGTTNLSGGVFNGNGSITVAGGALNLSGAAVNMGNVNVTAGTFNISAGTFTGNNSTVQVSNTGTFNIAGGTFNVGGNAAATLNGGSATLSAGTFNGNGTLTVNGGNFNVTGGNLTNFTLTVSSGTVNQSGGTADVGATTISSGNFNISSGTFDTGSNDLSVTGGTFNQSGGAITVGNASVTGGIDTINGTFNASGHLTVGTNSTPTTLNIGSGGAVTITGLITINNSNLRITSGINLAGGTLTATRGLTFSGTGIEEGTLSGFGTVTGAVKTGQVTDSGGTLDFKSAFDASGSASFVQIAAASGNVLKFEGTVGTVSIVPVVTFQGTAHNANGEILDLSAISSGASSLTNNFRATIAGFTDHTGNASLYEGILVSHATSVTLTDSTHIEVFDSSTDLGTVTFDLSMAGDYFHIINNDEIVICFMPGTLIRTPDGERPVEIFKSGDPVVKKDGEVAPVRWVGRQTVSRVFGDPMRVLPIRIKAGAVGDNLAERDLLLSPDHALLIDGVLIQAGALVNGTSIVREQDVPVTYTYYHLELDDHGLVLAEGVPAETFFDNIDRLAFDNWDEYEALYPEGKQIVEMDYPRAKAFRQVPRAIRARIAARAVALHRPRLDGTRSRVPCRSKTTRRYA